MEEVMQHWIEIAVPALVSLTAGHWIYFKVLKFAKLKNIVDNPNARKLQKSPVPVLGGMTVFFGLMAGALCGLCLSAEGCRLAPVLCAASVMFFTGLMDDTLGLSPRSRLLIEVLTVLGLIYGSGSCVDSLHGLWGVGQIAWTVGVPLTVLAGVGIINAVNMVDGVNGLSSGLSITASLLFGWAFVARGETAAALLALTFAGALVPFLFHNVIGRMSKMFIGDAGTMVMGVLMTWFLICLLRHDASASADGVLAGAEAGASAVAQRGNAVAFALSVLCVPVADTLRVMAMRMARGRSPFSADKTHLHHAFIRLCHSHSLTSMGEVAISLTVVGLWWLSVRLGAGADAQLYVVIVAAAVLVWGTYYVLSSERRALQPLQAWVSRTSVRLRQGEKRWWKRLQSWLDTPEEKLDRELEKTAEEE